MSALGYKLRCPHCLEEIDYLENPKQLPCNHIYCSPCLETLTETVQTGVLITCSICSTASHQFSHSCLPIPMERGGQYVLIPETSNGSVDDQSVEESAAACDRCKEEKKTAVCYCVNCERKLCPLHEERHQDYFSEEDKKHKLISIQVFKKTPTLYEKATCEEHGYCYGVCCKNCYCLKCPECENETRCTGKQQKHLNRSAIYYPKEHQFTTLKGIAALVREEFDILLKKCSERITKMCKLEKETWLRLDELEEECKGLREQIERKTEELISTIKTESARQIGHISQFESKRRKEVEEYLSELREKRENYERDSAACADFIRDNHVVEIVKQRDERKQSISVESSAQLALSVWTTDCIKDMVNGFIDFKINIIPQGIELISSHDTDGDCYTTYFGDDGKLFVGGIKGISLYSECYDKSTFTELKKMVTSIDRAEGYMPYLINVHREDVRMVRSTTDFVTSTEVFQYDCPGNEGRFAAVGSNYIAATCDPSSLVLFNKKTKKKFTRTLAYGPAHLQFLSDDSLLVTGGNAVRRYKITQWARLELMWTCEDLENVHGLCITSNGMIVATSNGTVAGKLYLLSVDGKLLKTLVHNELATMIHGQISIHDDVLAVPYWEKKKFKLFRLL